MRILEMLLIFNNLILVGLSLRKVNLKKFTVNIFNCTGFALLVSHYIIEGFRWQMYPVYLATAFYLIFFVCQFIIKKTTKNTYVSNKRIGKLLESRILNIVIILFLLLSILTTYILPVKFVNKPDGSYAVGTFSLFVEDRDRPEYYTSDPDDYRKFVIQFWYPADITEKNNIALWLPDGNAVTHGLARMVDFPSFTMEHMALIESNSFYNAPVSDKQDEYPVVIISHGWQGFRNIHTDIAELLASNGYIVISINHTFGAVATLFANGEVIYYKEDALPSSENPEYIESGNKLINTYSADIITLLDNLEEYNSSCSILSGRININDIGLIGHSTGGGAAVKTALVDSRIKAVLGLDPWVEPIKENYLNLGLDIPSLHLRSETWEDLENNNYLSILVNNSSQAYIYAIKGSAHEDFTIMPRITLALDLLNMSGPISTDKMWDIQSTFISSFFKAYLKDDNTKEDTIKRMDRIHERYREVSPVEFQE